MFVLCMYFILVCSYDSNVFSINECWKCLLCANCLVRQLVFYFELKLRVGGLCLSPPPMKYMTMANCYEQVTCNSLFWIEIDFCTSFILFDEMFTHRSSLYYVTRWFRAAFIKRTFVTLQWRVVWMFQFFTKIDFKNICWTEWD